MTIDELREERRGLAANVAGLIRDFEEKTGVKVMAVLVDHVVSPHEHKGERRDGVCAAVNVELEV